MEWEVPGDSAAGVQSERLTPSRLAKAGDTTMGVYIDHSLWCSNS